MKITNLIDEWRQMSPIEWAEHEYGWITEAKQPITLAEWQRVLLDEYWQRRDEVETLLISTVKKAGKTLLNSLLLCYRWLTLPGLHLALGNDRDQGAELQANVIAAMVRKHPILSKFVRITKNELTFEPTGSRIVTVPMDASSAAGSNFLTTSWSELWGFIYESNERLFEELTPIPLADSLRIIDSYAGFDAESLLLRRVWDRGLSGERINDDWPLYLTGKQLSFIFQGEEAQARCWRGTEAEREAYYTEQAATLRPNTYNRLHLNLWAGSESPFVDIAWWDRAAVSLPVVADGRLEVCIGVDAGLKRDSAVVVACTFDRETKKAMLVNHKVFYPRPGETLDIEDTLEEAVKDFNGRFRVREVRYDPWQFARSAQTLTKSRIKMAEYPQSTPNLTAMATNLYELLKGGNLIAYPSDDIRLALLRAVAVESARGVKITKEKQRHRIDVVVAMAMAALGSVELLGKPRRIPYSGRMNDLTLEQLNELGDSRWNASVADALRGLR